MLQQGSTALLALASVHVAVVVVFFWVLLANGIIATQIVEYVQLQHPRGYKYPVSENPDLFARRDTWTIR